MTQIDSLEIELHKYLLGWPKTVSPKFEAFINNWDVVHRDSPTIQLFSLKPPYWNYYIGHPSMHLHSFIPITTKILEMTKVPLKLLKTTFLLYNMLAGCQEF